MIQVQVFMRTSNENVVDIALAVAGFAALAVVMTWPLAAGLALFLSRVLVGVSPLDPLVFTLAPATLAAAAALATYVPARRATAVTPLEALRAE